MYEKPGKDLIYFTHHHATAITQALVKVSLFRIQEGSFNKNGES